MCCLHLQRRRSWEFSPTLGHSEGAGAVDSQTRMVRGHGMVLGTGHSRPHHNCTLSRGPATAAPPHGACSGQLPQTGNACAALFRAPGSNQRPFLSESALIADVLHYQVVDVTPGAKRGADGVMAKAGGAVAGMPSGGRVWAEAEPSELEGEASFLSRACGMA